MEQALCRTVDEWLRIEGLPYTFTTHVKDVPIPPSARTYNSQNPGDKSRSDGSSSSLREYINDYLYTSLYLGYNSPYGTVLGLRDFIPLSTTSSFISDGPNSWLPVSVECLCFHPQPKTLLTGRVIASSPDHIGLILYDLFNVSISRANIPENWTFDEEQLEENHTDDEQRGVWMDENGAMVVRDIEFEFLDVVRSESSRTVSYEGTLNYEDRGKRRAVAVDEEEAAVVVSSPLPAEEAKRSKQKNRVKEGSAKRKKKKEKVRITEKRPEVEETIDLHSSSSNHNYPKQEKKKRERRDIEADNQPISASPSPLKPKKKKRRKENTANGVFQDASKQEEKNHKKKRRE